jgi:hypothetical protein
MDVPDVSARRISTPTLQEFIREFLKGAPKYAKAWVADFPDPPKSGGEQWDGRAYTPTTALHINGSNAFFSVSAFRSDASSRGAEQALGVAVVLCDDVGTKANAERVRKALGDPSYRIITSPNNQQWGYFLTRLATPDEMRRIHQALKAGKLSDSDGLNAVRYARLPAGINNKPEYAKPFLVRCVAWSPARRYDPADLIKRLGADSKTLTVDFSGVETKVDSDALIAAVEWMPNNFDYDDWIRVGMALKKELGDDGLRVWIPFCKKYDGYNRKDSRAKWDSFKPTGDVTGLTILKMAYARGWKGSQREPWREPLNLLQDFTAPPYQGSDLPKVLGDFVDTFAEASGIDASIMAMSALIGAAAMIDDRWRLYLGTSGWYESARLWAVTIAPPGSGKTPAQDAALLSLKRRHSELSVEWRATVEGLTEEDPKPPLPRLFVTDTTIEALSEVLRDNPRGILIHYDELVSMLGSFDAYRGGGGVSRDRGEYLKLFGGGANQIERIKRGTVFVPNWGASILAGTTPTALAKLSGKLPNDGLLQRFLIAVGRRKLPVSHEKQSTVAVDAYANTLTRMLRKGTDQIVVVEMTPAALDMFHAWEADSTIRTEVAGTMSDGYESHVSKHAQMVARIALIFHFVETAHLDDVPPLTEKAMAQAIRFMHKADLHAMVLYTSLLNSAGPMLLAREVARMILSRQSDVIQRRQLTSGVLAFRDADDHSRDRALRLLEDYGWVRPSKGKYDTGHTTRWEVNPSIATLFAAEAEKERTRRAMIMEKIAATALERGKVGQQ